MNPLSVSRADAKVRCLEQFLNTHESQTGDKASVHCQLEPDDTFRFTVVIGSIRISARGPYPEKTVDAVAERVHTVMRLGE